MIQKILIANRGEIAIRILRTARLMGIKTVAVYSEVDRLSPHVLEADQALCIGASPARDSYLRGDKIIAAACQFGADAIHPGYGFLSEDSSFARAVIDAGITFIGPDPESMRLMGNKLAAKATLSDSGVPMVPGGDQPLKTSEEALTLAERIGYPVLVKAAAGGGGKGMRVVTDAASMPSELERARSEALSSFGDGTVFIEKYLATPRHIEIQIFADRQGNCVHLNERECSIQRRHQKVVEEAPSSCLSPILREKMGAAAVEVAKSCKYVGAGTVEFLYDGIGAFYFLEMNTRLQVEHPVTEMITGLDLVALQIRIAQGDSLPFSQEEVRLQGHAFELRIYAEDPAHDFVPSHGLLRRYQLPSGPGIRVDNGYVQGMEVPIYYDSMLAKLVAYGRDRNHAIARMLDAIADFDIQGIATTLPFGQFVFEHPNFIRGDFDTQFVATHYQNDQHKAAQHREAKIAAQCALKLYLEAFQTVHLPNTIVAD